MSADLPSGVTSVRVPTSRLETHMLRSGPDKGIPVVFIHGNVSSGRFFAELMAQLPDAFTAYAPDLRGFGQSEGLAVDATKGIKDFSKDVRALLDTLEIGTEQRPVHLVGWSVGGGVLMQMAIDDPTGIASLTLEAPMSPFGFGGTRDDQGAPCFQDWAGTGGGTANPEFVQRLGDKDLSQDSNQSPRNILRTYYLKDSDGLPKDLEDAYVEAMVDMVVRPENYPGDMTPSENWPTVAPGTKGVNNAIAGKWCDLSGFSQVKPQPPVLWIRGAEDQVVSDTSLFDFGYLGKLGAVPGWPGDEAYPPQPMVSQTRAVLDQYQAQGGEVREEILEDCGHSPHLEKPEAFLKLLLEQITP
jgi:pimeloyl-ACP methyl ester carboxylesterase